MATATKKAKATTTTKKETAKVSLKLTKENPFYGKRALLDMMQQVSKMTDSPAKLTVFKYLDAAWKESTDRTSKELFFVLMFAFGDVANRDHNVLAQKFGRGKTDGGGNSLRRVFLYCMEWLIAKDAKQFYAFLPIISEYTNLENSFFYQIRTNRKTGKVEDVISIVPKEAKKRAEFIDKVSDHFAKIIRDLKTPDVQHKLLAKFLPKPKFAQRTRTGVNKKSGETYKKKYSMQPQTHEKELFEKEFMTVLSKKLGWEMISYEKNTRFIGLEKYKAAHNRLSEAYLFSTKSILLMDKEQFFKWLNTLPAGARFRVQRRLFNKDGDKLVSKKKWIGKFGDLADFYTEWLNQKDAAASVARELEVKKKTVGGLTEDEQVLLKAATKASKVNTGADTLLDAVAELYKQYPNQKEFDVKVENMMRKVDIKVPTLVIADTSGSMSSNSVTHKGVTFKACDIARLAATTFLLKNPDPDLQQLLVVFNDRATVITEKSKAEVKSSTNRFMAGHTCVVDKIVDPELAFSKNYEMVSKLVGASGSTNLASVADALKQWSDAVPTEKEARKEMINNYPVWLVISDGDINHSYNASASVQDFMMKMKQWFGWNGVLVIWDVKNPYAGDEANKFDNVENVIYYGSCNAQALNQIFTNIDDLDVIDIYQSLLSMHRSNRYEPVRELVCGK